MDGVLVGLSGCESWSDGVVVEGQHGCWTCSTKQVCVISIDLDIVFIGLKNSARESNFCLDNALTHRQGQDPETRFKSTTS